MTKSFAKKCRNLKIRYGRGNVLVGKCLSGEMSSRGRVLRGSVRSGNCPFGEMSIGEVSVGEVSVGDLPLGKCQSGKCPVGKLSYNQKMYGVIKGENRLYEKKKRLIVHATINLWKRCVNVTALHTKFLYLIYKTYTH